MARTMKLLMMDNATDVENVWGLLRQKVNALQTLLADKFAAGSADLFSSDVFSKLLHDIQHFFASMADKFRDVFDPETLEIFLRWAPVVALAAVGLVCGFYALGFICAVVAWCLRLLCQGLYYVFLGFYYCCLWLLKGLFYGILYVWRGCCGCLHLMGVAMMTAPGTLGLLIIPRCLFEYNPRLIFAGLRVITKLLVSFAANKFIVTSFGVGIVAWTGLKLAGVF